jgi:hypothetical protein
VLVVLKPGSETARRPLIRRLVVLWIAQNLFLVASTALRTLDYVEVYSLTRMRIAALIWMGLVATGLVLICWRLLRAKSGAWLINANALATLAVLAAVSVVDLGAVSAAWNVRHAEEVGGAGAELDLCYLGSLGQASLVPLAELERRPIPEELRVRVAIVRTATSGCWSTSRTTGASGADAARDGFRGAQPDLRPGLGHQDRGPRLQRPPAAGSCDRHAPRASTGACRPYSGEYRDDDPPGFPLLMRRCRPPSSSSTTTLTSASCSSSPSPRPGWTRPRRRTAKRRWRRWRRTRPTW